MIKLNMARLEYCIVMNSHLPGNDVIFLYKVMLCSYGTLFSLDINRRIAFAFKLVAIVIIEGTDAMIY